MPDTEDRLVVDIFGLAICRYADSDSVYRFSCDANWAVENDAPYDTPEQAMKAGSTQFDVDQVQWMLFDT